MIESSVAIEVDETVESVWESLTDISAHPGGSDLRVDIVGDVEQDSVIRITLNYSEATERSITARITTFKRNEELEWVGTAFFSWLFETTRQFTLSPVANGGTRVVIEKQLSGVLAPHVAPPNLQKDEEKVAQELADHIAN